MPTPLKFFQQKYKRKRMLTCSMKLGLPWEQKCEGKSWQGISSGLLRRLGGKESACQYRRLGLSPWVGKIAWRRKWKPAPIFLPRKFHRQRTLSGYSPWSHKELDTAEWLNNRPDKYKCRNPPKRLTNWVQKHRKRTIRHNQLWFISRRQAGLNIRKPVAVIFVGFFGVTLFHIQKMKIADLWYW